jgi:hypothetical protein
MMYDRMLKAELMNSDRWLDLQSDSHRLAYVCLLPLADDFGNLEGGTRRLWRYLHARTQIKDEAHAVSVLSDLMGADLIRPYKASGIEYWHLPRFECDRRYVCRRVPASPWDDPELERRAKHYREYHKARRIESKRKNKKSDPDLTMNRRLTDAVQVLGVGVGVGVDISTKIPTSTDSTVDAGANTAREKPRTTVYPPGFSEFWSAYPKKVGKDKAFAAWKKRRPDRALLDIMLASIATHKALPKWQEPGAQYIPNPATWLNEGRWMDEISPQDCERGFVS